MLLSNHKQADMLMNSVDSMGLFFIVIININHLQNIGGVIDHFVVASVL